MFEGFPQPLECEQSHRMTGYEMHGDWDSVESMLARRWTRDRLLRSQSRNRLSKEYKKLTRMRTTGSTTSSWFEPPTKEVRNPLLSQKERKGSVKVDWYSDTK